MVPEAGGPELDRAITAAVLPDQRWTPSREPLANAAFRAG